MFRVKSILTLKELEVAAHPTLGRVLVFIRSPDGTQTGIHIDPVSAKRAANALMKASEGIDP